MEGRVLKFNQALCWGTILGADEVVYYVHTTDVLGPRLVAGCRVAFTAGYARHRPRALEVVRVDPVPLPTEGCPHA
jgi:cold shock CspA family protein